MTQNSVGSVGQLPPQEIEAEMSVLGGMLLGNETRTLEALEILTSADFYRDAHGHIFDAARRVVDRGEPLDIVTLHASLPDVGVSMAYLLQLSEFVPSPASIGYYAKIVRETATLRRLRELAADTWISAGNKGGEAAGLIADIERRVLELRPPEERKQTRGIAELIRVVNDRFEEREQTGGGVTGLATGFDDLDFYTAGLQSGDVIVIAARSSMGKTILGMNLARNVAGNGNVAAVFSLEMQGESVTERLMAAESSVSAHARRTGLLNMDDWKQITEAGQRLYDLPLVIDDNSSATPAYIRSKCKAIKAEYGSLGLVVIDYLQFMSMGSTTHASENRNLEIGNIMKALKALAKDFNIPVIVLCQISRSVEKREDKRPMLSDLRDSGNIEQDADLVLGIYRASYYARKTASPPPDSRTGVETPPKPSLDDDLPDEAELLILKQRNGPVGVTVKLGYEGRFFRFTNLPESPEGAPDF
ncbi:replicative DNA helicase [Armatimonas sp.]|uniref:replicative DNA helicase n=1 Tax=Armatimonas sp. TaxID=1872638 RepID=UPI00374DEADD